MFTHILLGHIYVYMSIIFIKKDIKPMTRVRFTLAYYADKVYLESVVLTLERRLSRTRLDPMHKHDHDHYYYYIHLYIYVIIVVIVIVVLFARRYTGDPNDIITRYDLHRAYDMIL